VTCLSTEELAGLYDGTLPAERAARARSHLSVCRRCVHELHCLHRILLGVPASPLPPEDLVQRVPDRCAPVRQNGPQPATPRVRAQLLRK